MQHSQDIEGKRSRGRPWEIDSWLEQPMAGRCREPWPPTSSKRRNTTRDISIT